MNLKDRIAQATRKATEMVHQHRGAIDSTIDKAGTLASSTTGGKYEEKIRQGSQGLRTGLDKLAPAQPGTEPGPANPPMTESHEASPDGPAVSPAMNENDRHRCEPGTAPTGPETPNPER